jgi:hypothetical protein
VLAPTEGLGGAALVGGVLQCMWQPTAAEAIYRETPRSKGGAELGPKQARSAGLGRPTQARFGPVRPRFAPRRFLVYC